DAIVLDQDIRPPQQLVEYRATRGIAQIELHAALAAVVGDKMRAVLAAAEAAERIAALRVLDLDHFRAEVGQHHAGKRSGDHGAELEHAHASEHLGHRYGSMHVAS